MATFVTRDEETIIAQCTPQGSGAIALLRLSGSQAIEIADRFALLPADKRLIHCQTHTIEYGWVIDDNGQKIDQVLFLLMKAPRTFTGQNTIEITCHNNQFLVDHIIQQALNCGARIAQPGEFTRRSFLNNKIDLVQAEAINELIGAQTELALKQSLAQLEGSFSSTITALEKNLVHALALSEASFEFLDEEMQFGDQIKTLITNTLAKIKTIKANYTQQDHIRQGVRIALIGSVNTGKSSLFNAFIGKKRAIVTAIAGTTRDTIEAGISKKGNFWTLIDTAGLRATDDIIEQEGIAKSLEQADHSDIILLVFDGSRELSEPETHAYAEIVRKHQAKCIIVRTKKDLPQIAIPLIDSFKTISVCAQTRENVADLENAIADTILELFSSFTSPHLLTKRHYHLLIKLEQNLQQLNDMITDTVQYELLSYHLNDAIAQLSELTGKTISEAAMDAVFREFCVGK